MSSQPFPPTQANEIPQQQPPQSQPLPQQQSQQAPLNSFTSALPDIQPIEPKRLQDLVNEVDPDEQLDEDVESVLLDIADEFIESVVSSACTIAKHRNSSTLEVDDVKLFLERKYKIWVPGFGDRKPPPKRFTSEAHRQRMALINKQQDNKPADEQNKNQKK